MAATPDIRSTTRFPRRILIIGGAGFIGSHTAHPGDVPS